MAEYKSDVQKLRDDYTSKIEELARIEQVRAQNLSRMQDGSEMELSTPYTGEIPTYVNMAGVPIVLPNKSRSEYQRAACESIFGTDITRNPNFTQLNPQHWDVEIHENNPGDGYIRKELAYYLELLYNLMAGKLGVTRLTVCSSFRNQQYNTALYDKLIAQDGRKRVNYSAHMAGLAVDITLTGNDRYRLADAAWNMNFGGIAIGKTFVHLDLSSRGTWTYPGVPEYKGPGRWQG